MDARKEYSDEEVCGIIMQTMKQFALDYDVQDTEFSTAIFIRKRSCGDHYMLNSWYKDQLRKTKKEMTNLDLEDELELIPSHKLTDTFCGDEGKRHLRPVQ